MEGRRCRRRRLRAARDRRQRFRSPPTHNWGGPESRGGDSRPASSAVYHYIGDQQEEEPEPDLVSESDDEEYEQEAKEE